MFWKKYGKIFTVITIIAATLLLNGCQSNGSMAEKEENIPVAGMEDNNGESGLLAEQDKEVSGAEGGDTDEFSPAGSADGSSLKGTNADEAASAAGIPQLTCYISISCDVILDNMDKLAPEKAGLIPADGVILAATAVEFTDGESVFDILQRVCRENSIHLEFSTTPAYGSAYIEGINNIYEMDAGDLSGWMFSINGMFPNYGCSGCYPEEGDQISWVYTCDLGHDVGGGY